MLPKVEIVDEIGGTKVQLLTFSNIWSIQFQNLHQLHKVHIEYDLVGYIPVDELIKAEQA